MSRRIQTKATVLAPGETDDYKSRVLKYIPAEVVALYISATNIVPEGPRRITFLWFIFGFCLIAVPVYLYFATRAGNKTPLWLQIVLATIAFPVWTYALGGPFVTTPGYEPFVGALLLMGVTFIFGVIEPT